MIDSNRITANNREAKPTIHANTRMTNVNKLVIPSEFDANIFLLPVEPVEVIDESVIC